MDSSFSPPKALCTGILHRFVLWVAEWDLHESSLLSILHKCSTGSSRKFESWVTGLVVLNCFETFLWYDVESVVLMLYCSWLMCVSSSHHSHQVCSVILKINAFFFLLDHLELHAQVPAQATHSQSWWEQCLWIKEHCLLHPCLSRDSLHLRNLLSKPQGMSRMYAIIINIWFRIVLSAQRVLSVLSKCEEKHHNPDHIKQKSNKKQP